MKALHSKLAEADGLGELGLDFGPKLITPFIPFKEKQITAFEWQLSLLSRIPKPLVLHIVRAHPAAIQILEKNGPLLRGGMVHSFSGSREIAQKYLDLGLCLSISGGITRKGFETLKRAVSYIPLDQLLVETDSPDQPLAAETASGLNEPSSLIEIAKAISVLRQKSGGESAEQILEASSRNVARIFSQS